VEKRSLNFLTFIQVDQELKLAIKETRVIAKLIKSGSTCLVCFVSNPFLIERHHVGGIKHSSVTIPLCANCHVLASKNQISYDKKWLEFRKLEPEKVQFVINDLEFLIGKMRRIYEF